MRAKVFITNIDYFIHPVNDKPVIRVFGRTDKGEALTLYDEKPYPYL